MKAYAAITDLLTEQTKSHLRNKTVKIKVFLSFNGITKLRRNIELKLWLLHASARAGGCGEFLAPVALTLKQTAWYPLYARWGVLVSIHLSVFISKKKKQNQCLYLLLRIFPYLLPRAESVVRS